MKKKKKLIKFIQKLKPSKRKKIEKTLKRNSKGWRVRMPLYTFLGEGVGTPTRHDGRLMRRQLVSRPGRTGVPAAHPPPPRTSPRGPLEEDGDRRTTSTCRWSRREVPTCRSPLVAARSRRVSWAGYQERGGVRRRSASRRWSGVDGRVPVAPVLGRRDALPGRHTSMWVDDGTRGWGREGLGGPRVDSKIFGDWRVSSNCFRKKFIICCLFVC